MPVLAYMLRHIYLGANDLLYPELLLLVSDAKIGIVTVFLSNLSHTYLISSYYDSKELVSVV